MNRLLIISCSNRKNISQYPMRAIDRYDGPSFQIIKKYIKNGREKPDIYILSAKYGLMSEDCIIGYYDQLMTKERAEQLNSQVIHDLKQILGSKDYHDIMVNVPNVYLSALNGYEKIMPQGVKLNVSRGPMGEKLRDLREWLYQKKQPRKKPKINVTGKASLRGKTCEYTPGQIKEIAVKYLKKVELKTVNSNQRWYVEIDGQKIAPKKLVSLLFDLSVREFSAEEARRVLGQLGIEAKLLTEQL